MYMRLGDYCEEYGVNYQTLYLTIYEYENKGELPIFAKRDGSNLYVDPSLVTYYTDKERTAWQYSTDRLYWLLTDWMGLSQLELSRQLASRSTQYKDYKSWSTFISTKLFGLPESKIYSPRVTMTQEFAMYGTMILLDYWFENYETLDNPNYQEYDWDNHISNTAWIRYQEAV